MGWARSPQAASSYCQVCSAVRRVLFNAPSSRISLRSLVQVSEVRAGGGAGRNCEPAVMLQGVMAPAVEKTGIVVSCKARP